METKSKCGIVFFLIFIVVGSIIAVKLITDEGDRDQQQDNYMEDEEETPDYPDLLEEGQDPVLSLPIKETDHINDIQAFGDLGSYKHNGIDFNVIQATTILCPHDAYVEDIRFYYNDAGGHWQTNVRLDLNDEWWISMKFESWASSEEEGQAQADAINLTIGDKLNQGQEMGMLLSQGEYSHLHFDVDNNGTYLCPYSYFSADAKSEFDVLFSQYGTSEQPCN